MYRLFGDTFASSFPFTTPLQRASDSPTFSFSCLPGPPPLTNAPIYRRPEPAESGKYPIHFFPLNDCFILRFAYVGDFYIWPDRVICHLADPEAELSLMETYFLGPVASFRLEQRHIPTLHASAVVIDEQAVAFLSHSGNGKSTLAATMLQAGALLLTDDILAVEEQGGVFYGRPSYPQMRFWPGEAEFFLGQAENLPLVSPFTAKRRIGIEAEEFGRFALSPTPLTCLYLPRRTFDDAPPKITALTRSEAVMELFRYSFFPSAVQQLGLTGRRLDFYSQLVRGLPIRRLVYPNGLHHLPLVREAIFADLASRS